MARGGDHDGHISNPFNPDPAMCCPCVFGDKAACWCGRAGVEHVVDEGDFPIQFYPPATNAISV